jgi:hypothetical protein
MILFQIGRNDTQHNDSLTQHELVCDTEHNNPLHYAECLVLFSVMFNVLMQSVVMLNVIMLSVVMLNVVVP